MGVYINGVEMPKDRGVYIAIDIDGQVYTKSLGALEWRRLEQKAVPVPPHGRLIAEADAVETTWMILRGLGYLKEENPKLEQTVREVFATAPAIEVEEHG